MGFNAPNIQPTTRPMQVRFFRETELAALESAVNVWLSDHPRYEIAEVRQSPIPTADGSTELIVSVWYIED
jgi:hypothetical protein